MIVLILSGQKRRIKRQTNQIHFADFFRILQAVEVDFVGEESSICEEILERYYLYEVRNFQTPRDDEDPIKGKEHPKADKITWYKPPKENPHRKDKTHLEMKLSCFDNPKFTPWRIPALKLKPHYRVAQDWGLWDHPEVYPLLEGCDKEEGDELLREVARRDVALKPSAVWIGKNAWGVWAGRPGEEGTVDENQEKDVLGSAEPSSAQRSALDLKSWEQLLELAEKTTPGNARAEQSWKSCFEERDFEFALDCEWWNPRPLSLIQLAVRNPTPAPSSGERDDIPTASPSSTSADVVTFLIDMLSVTEETLCFLQEEIFLKYPVLAYSPAEDKRRLVLSRLLPR